MILAFKFNHFKIDIMIFQKQIILKGLIFAQLLLASYLQAQFSVTIKVNQNIDCFGGNNGSLTAEVFPAGTAYTFSWSNGGNTATINDLTAGAYIVTVQNAAGGSAIATALLSEPEELVLSSLTELPLFVNPTGTVEIETSGGTAPYAFQWVNDANIPFSNQEDLVDAPAGIYTQTATDANGCTAVLTPVELVLTSAAHDAFAYTLRAYPNPASKNLVLEIPEGQTVKLQIFNELGQIVETQNLLAPLTSISVEAWPAGCYSLVFLELHLTERVIVSH